VPMLPGDSGEFSKPTPPGMIGPPHEIANKALGATPQFRILTGRLLSKYHDDGSLIVTPRTQALIQSSRLALFYAPSRDGKTKGINGRGVFRLQPISSFVFLSIRRTSRSGLPGGARLVDCR